MALAKVGCPHCAKTIEKGSPLCPHCGHATGFTQATATAAPPPRLEGSHYCTQCGTVANPKKHTKGSFLIEVFLWLLLIVPGLIYSLWRLTSKQKVCPACKSPSIVPVTSPVAQAALKSRGA
jgi:RNA polymerase subunit RPABC4/transcription elongation factor Spt4